MNLLESLKRSTTVVADTGDIDAIARHRPQDATTNPSLLLHAAQQPRYQHLVDEALNFAVRTGGDRAARSVAFMDRLFIDFGREILKSVPGRVSTEVDAGLSFDTQATIAKARKLIGMYREAGIGRERVLIKIASTWEGIRASARPLGHDVDGRGQRVGALDVVAMAPTPAADRRRGASQRRNPAACRRRAWGTH